jgi:hypothetical protein
VGGRKVESSPWRRPSQLSVSYRAMMRATPHRRQPRLPDSAACRVSAPFVSGLTGVDSNRDTADDTTSQQYTEIESDGSVIRERVQSRLQCALLRHLLRVPRTASSETQWPGCRNGSLQDLEASFQDPWVLRILSDHCPGTSLTSAGQAGPQLPRPAAPTPGTAAASGGRGRGRWRPSPGGAYSTRVSVSSQESAANVSSEAMAPTRIPRQRRWRYQANMPGG